MVCHTKSAKTVPNICVCSLRAEEEQISTENLYNSRNFNKFSNGLTQSAKSASRHVFLWFVSSLTTFIVFIYTDNAANEPVFLEKLTWFNEMSK